MNRRLAPVVAVVLSLAGCSGKSTPASPTTTSTSSVVSPAGNWTGSISDSISGDGTMQLSLNAQASNSNALIGTWSATFKNSDSFSGLAFATLLGSDGYAIVMYAEPPPPCASVSGPGSSALLGFTLINVVVTSSRLTAVAGRTSCSSASFGMIDLSKQ